VTSACFKTAFLVTAFCSAAVAQPPDPLTASAFDHFYNLEYKEAAADFRAARDLHPHSADAWIYVAQGVFYTAMYDSGITEADLVNGQSSLVRTKRVTMTPRQEAEFNNALDTAESLEQQRLAANPQDSSALFGMGGITALRASYALLVKHAWFTALRNTSQSRHYFEEVIRLDPSNCDARLVPAINEYVVGKLPPLARFAARAVGMTGNKERGLLEIQHVAACGRKAHVNAAMLAAEIARRENRLPEAIAYLEELTAAYPRNFRLRLDLVTAYNRAGQHQKADQSLQALDAMLDRGSPGYSGERAARIRRERDAALRQVAGDRENAPQLAAAG
jgi:tetratricopeptide (TPR) repeat protein